MSNYINQPKKIPAALLIAILWPIYAIGTIKNKTMLLAVSLSIIGSGCAEIVQTGERGIKTTFGKVVSESLTEGIYFYMPFTSNIVTMDTKTIRLESKTSCYTKDLQQGEFAYVVNFSPNRTLVHKIYTDVGKDWVGKIVPQTIEGSLKNTVGKWNAVDLIENRNKATEQAKADILEALKERDINLESFAITGIDYTDVFERSVEDKVVAIQRAVESENKTKQIEEEAKQKVIAAKAEAESMRIRAQALTQNKSLVDYEAVQKWNGVLPQYSMGGTIPFISLGAK